MVVVLDKIIDALSEFFGASEGTAANGALCDKSKPALHLIEP